MLQLTAQLAMKDAQLLGRAMTRRIAKIVDAEKAASRAAAAEATTITRASFRYKRPANVPPRAGRPSTGGQFREFLRWTAQETSPDGGVAFDMREADRRIPYWIILEIGTGHSATLRSGGAANPAGRPRAGASYVRTVPAQRGRAIPSSLVWASGPRGTYTPPGANRNQQLYLRSQVKGAPVWVRHARRQMYITREIEPQNFVRKGGQEGFRQYRTSVLAAARRTFAGRGYRP